MATPGTGAAEKRSKKPKKKKERIDTVAARVELTPRVEPYWTRISAGCQLGFRKMTAASIGTWVAKFRDPDTHARTKKSLGDFETFPASQRYDAAKADAEAEFKRLGRGGPVVAITVKGAGENYVKHLETRGKAATATDVERRFARYVDGHHIGSIPLKDLRPGHVEAWRKLLAVRPVTLQGAQAQGEAEPVPRTRTAGTLNRDMTALRAALNLAKEDGHVDTDMAWAAKLRPVRDADRRRDVYLDLTQRRALIAKAPADLAVFLSALSLVPLRPGAIAALVAGSYDKRLSTLTIGKDKAGADRKITLPKATAEFFAQQAKDKLPTAPLLARADGKAWDKDFWKGPVKAAVTAAELPPAITAYALRHSVITDLVALHKLDTMTVAQLSGTSIVMIEKHYGHLLREHASAALASLTL